MNAELQLCMVSAPASSFAADLERLGFSPLGIRVLEAGITRGKVTTGQISLSLPDRVRGDDRLREVIISDLLRHMMGLGVEIENGLVPAAKSDTPHNRRRAAHTPAIRGKSVKAKRALVAKASVERSRKSAKPKEQVDGDAHLSSTEERDADRHRASDVVAMYCQEAGRYPLLTAEQEIALSKRFREEHDLEARNELISHNLRLVMSIARHFLWSGLPFADLVQYGNQGLMRAAVKYDYRKGFRFTTYATWWIRQCIYRGIESGAYAIRYPAYMHRELQKLHTAIAAIAGDSRELPSPDQIAKEMGVPLAKVMKILEVLKLGRLSSLDADMPGSKRDGSTLTLGEVTADSNTPDPMWIVAAREELSRSCKIVEDVVETIPRYFQDGDRNAAIFREMYGVNQSRERMTLGAVGKIHGLTRERIRQVIAEIWRKEVFVRAGLNDESFRTILERIADLEQSTGIAVTFQD